MFKSYKYDPAELGIKNSKIFWGFFLAMSIPVYCENLAGMNMKKEQNSNYKSGLPQSKVAKTKQKQ